MPDKIRAKMRVSSVEDFGHGEKAKLQAVCGNAGENASYSKATPFATLEIQIDNPDARGFFKPGGEFYLDFTPAPKAT